MSNFSCPLCAAGGCLDMVLAHRELKPVKCPTNPHFIYFKLPAGMVKATAEDFFKIDGSPRINMPYLIYDTKLMYHAFFMDEFTTRQELEAWVELDVLYILEDHKQFNN
jgi:hypothetical protein